MTLNTIPDIEVIEHLDFEAEITCESKHHDKHLDYHGGGTRHMVVGPCLHTTGYRCEIFVQQVSRDITGVCQTCGMEIPASSLVIIPLNRD